MIAKSYDKMKAMERLVLIDGHALLHRAYHAYPPLTTSKGDMVNAVYGFTSILLSVLKQLKPKYVAVTFDKKAPTFRHKEYKGYKASRPKIDDELKVQIPKIFSVVQAFNMPIFAKDGFEADDLIGTLAKQAKIDEVMIVTGDRDALQLVDEKIKVFIPGRSRQPVQVFDPEKFRKKYGFEPELLVDFKALAGDASDDIPGVKGIGGKGAQKLIQKFGTLEDIYKNLDNIKKLPRGEKTAKLLTQDKKTAFLSKKLAKIITNVPLKFKLSDCCLLEFDKDKIINLLKEFEFHSLLNKLPSKDWEEEEQKKETNKESKKDQQNQMELF
jgi:DNA polymerase I